MAGHLSASTAGTLARRREIAARKRAAERELAAAEARLTPPSRAAEAQKVAFVEVVVDLEARRPPKPRSISPITCPARSWRSLYDLVLDGDRLDVSYLAEVTQQTGEDWPEVALGSRPPGLARARPCPS